MKSGYFEARKLLDEVYENTEGFKKKHPDY
jgi:hypothetical protein